MTYAQQEYAQPHDPADVLPLAFRSLMKSLEGHLQNLRPEDRRRGQGIVDNVRRHNRCTEKQFKEIVRLEKLSKRRAEAPDTPLKRYRRALARARARTGTFDPNKPVSVSKLVHGGDYVHDFAWRQRLEAEALHEYRTETDPEYVRQCAEDAEAGKLRATERHARMMAGMERRARRLAIQRWTPDVRKERLAQVMPYTAAHLVQRDLLIGDLRQQAKTLAMSLAHETDHGTREALEFRVARARICLVAERLAKQRDLAQAKILSQDAAE